MLCSVFTDQVTRVPLLDVFSLILAGSLFSVVSL